MPARSRLVDPPVQLRALLVAARERGEPFDVAWQRALDGRRLPDRVRFPHGTQERRQWRAILAGQRRHWRSAYERRASVLAVLPRLPELACPDDSSTATAGSVADEARAARAPMHYVMTPVDVYGPGHGRREVAA